MMNTNENTEIIFDNNTKKDSDNVNIIFGDDSSNDETQDFKILHGSIIQNLELDTSILNTISDGSTINFNLTVVERQSMLFGVNDGNDIDYNLSITPSFTPKLFNGGVISFTIGATTSYNQNIYDGTNTKFDLYTQPARIIKSILDIGCVIKCNLNTTPTFTESFSYGSVVDTTIDYKFKLSTMFNVYDGNNILFDMNTNKILSSLFFNGICVYANIKTKESFKLNTKLKNDTCVDFNLSISKSLDCYISDGTHTSNVSIDNDDIHVINHGNHITFNLNNSINVNSCSVISGEFMLIDIKYGTSEPLSEKNTCLYNGCESKATITTLESIYFKDINITHGYEFIPHPFISTFIDMNVRSCYDNTDIDMKYINLKRGHDSEVSFVNSDNMLKMTFDLSVPRLFDFTIEHGNELNVVEYDNMLSCELSHDISLNVFDIYTMLNITLSNGNVNYKKNNIVIDTSNEYYVLDTEYSRVQHGNNVVFELSTFREIQSKSSHGECVIAKIKSIDAWRSISSYTQHVKFKLSTDIKINGFVEHGNTLRDINFYVEPLLIQCGDYCSFDMNINYDVEFIDVGCLPNENIEYDKNGVPIYDDDKKGICVEGEKFSKFIKGRCY